MRPFYRLKVFFEALAQFREITPHQARVYRALLSYFGRDGCFPSHATLAFESGVSERTVRNTLREGRLRGWITWSNARVGRRQTSNRYTITISAAYVNEVLNGLHRLKRKIPVICAFFRRQGMPGSPYFYIKRETSRMWKTFQEPSERLTPWQQLFRDNREAAMAQIFSR